MDKFKQQQIKHDMLFSITAKVRWVSAIKVGTVNVMEGTNKELFNFIISFEDASDITVCLFGNPEKLQTLVFQANWNQYKCKRIIILHLY